MSYLHEFIGKAGVAAPWICVVLFLSACFLVVWRLESLSRNGVEGTVLGTIFMPFCSGMGNIVFAVVVAAKNGSGDDVAINCLFNNVTNLTLLLGLPVILWGMESIPRKKNQTVVREFKVGRLSLALNLVAALFFSSIVWLLAADGELARTDGAVLLVLFLFWQCFHVYDVRKTNILKKKNYPRTLPIEVAILLLCAFVVFISTDWLVQWFNAIESTCLPAGVLGWASGILTVLPNAVLAFYYGARNRMDVLYTSQSGDAHICIPLCLGLFASIRALPVDPFFQQSLAILMGLCAFHLVFVVAFGRMPRSLAAWLVAAFAYFLWIGMA